jgi:xanthine dehydrogenase YagT iron-sulfur-binding subunit
MTITINGSPVELPGDPRVSLLDLLREHLHLFGAKKGCDQGACGACTVLVDGERVLSCLALAVQCQGREVTTIEGLAPQGDLHPLQKAFVEHDGFQCGYCTPGQICSAVGMARELRQGVPSHVTADLRTETHRAQPRRAARAHERQRVPVRRLQRHRRGHLRDLRDLRNIRRSRHDPLHLRPRARRRRCAAAGQPARRQVPGRRHEPGRPDARDHRASDRPGRCDGPVVRHRRARRRQPADRRGDAQHGAGLAPRRAGALPAACPGHHRGRVGADPQHGDGGRQHAAAHALRLFLRRRPLALQQAQPGPGVRRRRRHQPLPRDPGRLAECVATHPSDMCVALAALGAVVQICATRTANARCRSPICIACPGTVPTRETLLEPGELITAVELPALPFAARSTYRKVRDRVQLRLRAGLGGGCARARRRHRQGRAHRPGWRRAQAVARLEGGRGARAGRPPRRLSAPPPRRNWRARSRCATTDSRSNWPRARSPPCSPN